MPTAEDITRMLATMANDLTFVAVAWHVAIAAAVVALVRGWRPSARVACIVLSVPILSVGVASLAYESWFNAVSFMGLALVLAVLGKGLTGRIAAGPMGSAWPGIAAIAFGLVYPHFVHGSWYRALVAAPVGVVPCPTLSLVAGAVIVAGGFGSRAIPLLLAIWVAFYAWFGVFELGVTLDLGLVVALLGLARSLRCARPTGCRGAKAAGARDDSQTTICTGPRIAGDNREHRLHDGLRSRRRYRRRSFGHGPERGGQ